MVHVNKDYGAPPEDLMDVKWADTKLEALNLRHGHEAKTSCYRDTTIDALVLLYNDKCAYCERDRGIELQVDHYRSKKPRAHRITTEHNHPGYYWLCYEWSNLLPACSKCNLLKSTYFPIAGTRVVSHHDFNGQQNNNTFLAEWLHQQEEPLLLNPEIDTDFERDFVFLNNGHIRHRTVRGDATIWVCQLNRPQLIKDRLKVLKDLAKKITASFDDYGIDQSAIGLRGGLRSTFRSITYGAEPDHAFSLYHQFIYNYFHYYVGSHLPAPIRAAAIDYFDEYKANG